MLTSNLVGGVSEAFVNVWETRTERLVSFAASAAAATVGNLSTPTIEWIDHAQAVAKSGYPQAIAIASTVVWSLKTTLERQQPAASSRHAPIVKPPLFYEILSQVARAASLAFAILATSGGARYYWFNAALAGYAFALGLLRIRNSIQWQKILLHQVNLLQAASLLLLLTSEFLPRAVLGSEYRAGRWSAAATLSSAIANVVSLATPRAWIPPSVGPELGLKALEPEPSQEETASWFDLYLSYNYLTPMIWKGCRRALEMADLPRLPWYDEPLQLLSSVLAARERSKQSTLWTVLRYQRTAFLGMVAWSMLSFSFELVAPFALFNLLSYISKPEDARLHPVVWLLLLFVGPMARTIFLQLYIFTSTRVLVRVRSGLIQELYQRAMTSMELEDDVINSIETRGGIDKGQGENGMQSTSTGRLANLMSSDIDGVCEARDVILLVFGTSTGVILSFIALYRVIGWSAFVGIVFMIVLTPGPAYLAQLMGTSQREVKLAQDSRISLLTEYLSSIKTIKYFAWEDAMGKRVQEVRGREQKGLWRITLLEVLMFQASELIPVAALALIFITYTGILKQTLDAAVAYTTLSLLMTMRRNIGMTTHMARVAVTGWIALNRLDRYFTSTTPLAIYPVGPVSLKKANFRRNKAATFTLKDVSLDFVEGGFNVVSGRSGSGKTTLLLSILGETILEGGSVTRPKDVAFASQTPWLQNETIKDNILFNSEFEQVRYDRVIEACALGVDLDELPKGDLTEVGENGMSLSGGQKARVALARALYSKAPLLLLDDTFSALDAKTLAVVWDRCFCSDLLRGRTTVLVTQTPWVPAQADFSVVLEDGTVKSSERNIGVVRKRVVLEHAEPEGADAAAPAQTDAKLAAAEDKPDDISEEMKATGSSNRLSVFKYMMYFGGPAYAFLTLFVTFLYNLILLASTYWLSVWVNAYDDPVNMDIVFYLGIYIALTVGTVLVDIVRSLAYANGAWIAAKRLHQAFLRSVLNVSLSWWKNVPVGRVINRFSRDMHSLDDRLVFMLEGTVEGAMQIFFRIGAISSILPVFMLPGIFACVVGVAVGEMYTRTAVTVRRLVASSRSPVFSQFSNSMDGLTVIRARSGMSQSFKEKLAGRLRDLSRAQESNYNINRWVMVRIDLATALVSACAAAIAVSKSSMLQAGLVGFSLANATGLSDTIMTLVRAMNELEIEMQSFHRVEEYAKLEPEEKTDDAHESEIQAIERYAVHAERAAPQGWPRSGSVELRNVTVRYDGDGPDILKDVNLKFEAGERVAIVGRTGSGKSTLMLSLLHFTTITAGTILYDGVDITAIPRKKLRQALTIIPQEATLFNGSVGSNLDPTDELPKSRLQKAIDSCTEVASFRSHAAQDQSHGKHENGTGAAGHNGDRPKPSEETPLLGSSDAAMNNGAISVIEAVTGLSLSTPVNAKGENFSHGQRQVLSLCRALVRKSKLMLLDEATASMDYQTDQGIQSILRADLEASEDSSRTLVTIAHRLRTIVDYDKVVVLAAGRVLEVGPPAELYKAKGQFYDMVRHSGEGEDLAALLSG